MTVHAQTLIKEAEKLIAEKKKEDPYALGREIDALPVHLAPQDWQRRYRVLYARAKQKSPEIWESTPYNLSSKAWYDNLEFFEMVGILDYLHNLVMAYPERENNLRNIFHKDEATVEKLYWSFYYWTNGHGMIPKWKDLLENTCRDDRRDACEQGKHIQGSLASSKGNGRGKR